MILWTVYIDIHSVARFIKTEGCSHRTWLCVSNTRVCFKQAQSRTPPPPSRHWIKQLPCQPASLTNSAQRLPRLWGFLIGPLFWNRHWWATLRIKVETWRGVSKNVPLMQDAIYVRLVHVYIEKHYKRSTLNWVKHCVWTTIYHVNYYIEDMNNSGIIQIWWCLLN